MQWAYDRLFQTYVERECGMGCGLFALLPSSRCVWLSLHSHILLFRCPGVLWPVCVRARDLGATHTHTHTHIQRHTSHIVCNQCAVRVQRSLLITCDESGPEWNTCVPWVLTTITTARGRGRGRWRRAENREGKLFNMELKLKNDVLLRH